MSPSFKELLLEGPALAPPPGVEPDFINHGSNHSLGYGIIICSTTLAVLSTMLRIYSRFILKRYGIGDALLIAALGLYAGFQYTMYSLSISPGLLVHQWNIRLKDLSPILFHLHIATIFYGLAIMCLKVVIILDWLFLFVPRAQRGFIFWASHVLIWTNILFYVVGNGVSIFQCNPRQRIWDKLVEGTCPIDMEAHMNASGVINLISDIAILLLPQKVIWTLKVTTQKKMGVSLIFAIGVFACACGILRLYYTLKMLNTDDKLYTISILGLWANGEMTAGFLIVGIPNIPLASKGFPSYDSVTARFKSMNKRISGKLFRYYYPEYVPEKSAEFGECEVRGKMGSSEGFDADKGVLVTVYAETSVLRHQLPPSAIIADRNVTITYDQRGGDLRV